MSLSPESDIEGKTEADTHLATTKLGNPRNETDRQEGTDHDDAPETLGSSQNRRTPQPHRIHCYLRYLPRLGHVHDRQGSCGDRPCI
jgi:hypothetical protein